MFNSRDDVFLSTGITVRIIGIRLEVSISSDHTYDLDLSRLRLYSLTTDKPICL